MEDQEKVTKCDYCLEKISGNTYTCCKPHETIEGMTHRGHTACQECAENEEYIENNRCKACLREGSGRRSTSKLCGYPLFPPQLNVLATNMLQVIRKTEESVETAANEADDARRQVGPSRRAEAIEDMKKRKQEREEQERVRLEKEAQESRRLFEEAQKQLKEEKEQAKKEKEEAEATARAEIEKEKKQAEARAKAEIEKEKKQAEARAKVEIEKEKAKAKDDANKLVEEAHANATRINRMVQNEQNREHGIDAGKKHKLTDEERLARADKAKQARLKKKEEEAQLRTQAELAASLHTKFESAVLMAKAKIAELGGDAEEWETSVRELL